MPKSTETFEHPAFPEYVREVEGADMIRKYEAAGWIRTSKPAPNPVEKIPAPVVDSPAPSSPDSPKEN